MTNSKFKHTHAFIKKNPLTADHIEKSVKLIIYTIYTCILKKGERYRRR